VRLYCLDNGSSDQTAEKIAAELPQTPFPVYFLRSLRNNGFARGVNLLAVQGRGDFFVSTEPDSELQDGCVEKLL